jgi:hypothetical protein
VSCYPTALLSKKLTQRPLKFQRVTAINSLDFVQFLKKELPPPPTEFWVTICVPEPIFFFRKIALDKNMWKLQPATYFVSFLIFFPLPIYCERKVHY